MLTLQVHPCAKAAQRMEAHRIERLLALNREVKSIVQARSELTKLMPELRQPSGLFGKRLEERNDRTQKVLTLYDKERALITVTEEA